MKANQKQLQLIHIAKTQLNIDDDIYREMLAYHCNVNSAKDLSYNQATFFIDLLKTKGFKLTAKKKTVIKRGDKVVRMASHGQLALIEILQANIVWHTADGYSAWLEKRMKIKKVITSGEAYKAIEGLKGMLGIKTQIISMKALPFPYTPEPKQFINSKTGEICEYLWMFDIKEKRLVCFNVEGGEKECLTSLNM